MKPTVRSPTKTPAPPITLGVARAVLALLVALMLVVAGLELVVVGLVRDRFERPRTISKLGLAVAMQTFRPPDRAGLSRPVSTIDLGPQRAVRSDPDYCAPLSLLSTGSALDGSSWSGVGGQPLQPVLILAVRFAGADQARREIWLKRAALLRCSTVRLTFPPFEEPAQPFSVRARTWPPEIWLNDRMAYALVSQGRRYEFYVRRFRNTVIWTYGDPEGVALRRGIVDSLADRLARLESP